MVTRRVSEGGVNCRFSLAHASGYHYRSMGLIKSQSGHGSQGGVNCRFSLIHIIPRVPSNFVLFRNRSVSERTLPLTQFMDYINQSDCVVDRRLRENTVSQIENMPRPTCRLIKNHLGPRTNLFGVG